jgi:hypothetical protein
MDIFPEHRAFSHNLMPCFIVTPRLGLMDRDDNDNILAHRPNATMYAIFPESLMISLVGLSSGLLKGSRIKTYVI